MRWCSFRGIGGGPGSWGVHLAAAPYGYACMAPRIAGLVDTDEAVLTFSGAVPDATRDLGRLHMCRARPCGL